MSIVSEIINGTWLLETNKPEEYRLLVQSILAGSKVYDQKSDCCSVLSKVEINSRGETIHKDKVSVICMFGEITKRGGMCSYGMDYICAQFLKYEKDPEIRGHIFHLDGPGGNADAMPMVIELKKYINKPVVALVECACSLHYWAAVELSDHIMMANNLTAEVGSIGAMIMFEKPTNEIIVVRPKESSDKNQGFIDALEGNTKILQEKLRPLAIAFQNGVKVNRPSVKNEDLKGKTFYAEEAIKRGFADSIGNMQKAYELVLTRAELQKLNQQQSNKK